VSHQRMYQIVQQLHRARDRACPSAGIWMPQVHTAHRNGWSPNRVSCSTFRLYLRPADAETVCRRRSRPADLAHIRQYVPPDWASICAVMGGGAACLGSVGPDPRRPPARRP
jgi:hypothetical protein